MNDRFPAQASGIADGAGTATADRLTVALLRSLQALLATQSVSGAAARLGVLQPAMSRHLAQLREITGDELMVRSGARMVLTERAEALRPVVERALLDLSLIGDDGRAFEPGRESHAFKLATYDFLPMSFFGELARIVRTESPASTLEIQTIGDSTDFLRRLCEGETDVAITSRMGIPGALRAVHLFTEPLYCVVRPGHRLLQDPSVETYRACEHLSTLAPSRGATAAIDALMAQAGLELRFALRTQYLSLVPAMIAQTDLVFTTGRMLATAMSARFGLCSMPVPAHVPAVSCFMVWHERTHHVKAAAWLREQIKSIAVPWDHAAQGAAPGR